MTLIAQVIDAVNEWSQQLAQFQQAPPEQGLQLAVLEEAAQQLDRKVARLSLQHALPQSDPSPRPTSLTCQC